jgi:hypothetical protein
MVTNTPFQVEREVANSNESRQIESLYALVSSNEGSR